MNAELKRRAKRSVATVGIGLLATVSAAACGSVPAGAQAGGAGTADGQAGGAGTTSGPGRTANHVTSDSGAAASTPSDRGATSANRSSGDKSGSVAGTPRCRADQLQVDLGPTKPAAGNRYAPLIFTNDSGRACALLGYPGVTVLNGDKEQIGTDAEWAPGNPVRQVTLSPGESTSSLLHWASRVAGECRPTSTYLRTFPPGSTEAIVVPTDIRLCGGIFYVRAVTAGTDGTAS